MSDSKQATGRDPHIEPVQQAFAGVLVWHVRVAIVLLVATFAVYVSGILPAGLPIERVPDLWHLSAEAYAEHSGRDLGWAWISELDAGGTLVFAALALFPAGVIVLVGVTAVLYLHHGVRAYAVIALAELVVLLVAATGVLTGGR